MAVTPKSLAPGNDSSTRFRFLLINALDANFAQFLYPTDTPQGLLALKAGLRTYFPEVDVRILSWDQLTARDPYEQFDRGLRRFAPSAVGISAYSSAMPLAMGIAARVRRLNPDIPVIVGGIHPSAHPNGISRYPMFDFYVRGEGIRVCAQLLRHLFLGESRLEEIPSLAFCRDGRTVLTVEECTPADMDENPAIDWTDLARSGRGQYSVIRMDENFCLELEPGPMFPYESNQGCKWRCRFCERVNGTRYRTYSSERVLADIVAIKEAVDVQYIFLTAEHLDYRLPHLESLLDALETVRHLGIKYYCSVRLGEVERPLIDRLVDAGVGILHVFPETGSPRIRELMKKDLDIDRWKENVAYASDQGVLVLAGFIAGWPSETLEDLEMSLEFARYPWIDFAYLPSLRCLANSDMRHHLVELGIEPDTPAYFDYLNNSRNVVLAEYDPEDYREYLRRFSELNYEKKGSERTRRKMDTQGCRLVHRPFQAPHPRGPSR